MSSETSYKLNEAAAQARLDKWSATADPSDLRREIGLVRSMIEAAAADKNAGLVNTLSVTLSRLTRSHVAAQRAAGSLLEKRTVLRLAQSLTKIIADEFAGVDRFQDRLAAVAERLSQAVGTAMNTEGADLDE